jgi:hypothetical protein
LKDRNVRNVVSVKLISSLTGQGTWMEEGGGGRTKDFVRYRPSYGDGTGGREGRGGEKREDQGGLRKREE